MNLNQDDILVLARRYTRYYAGRLARDLCTRKKVIPDLEIGQDKSAWTNMSGDKKVVHIGLGMFGSFPDQEAICRDEYDFHANMRKLIAHEAGHQKFSTGRALQMTVRNGCYGFVDYAVRQATGKPMRITKDSDMEKALKMLSDQYGMHVSFQMLQEFVHFIANSIEDGRMERLVGNEQPGFKTDMILCRAREWQHSPFEKPEQEDARTLCTAMMNQILSLATMGLWQKGFVEYSASPEGTKIQNMVLGIMPEIKAGVAARSCADGMRHASRIIEAMYPVFFEAVKLSEMEKALSDLISQAASRLPDLMADISGQNAAYEASEKDDLAMKASGQGDPSGKKDAGKEEAGSEDKGGNGANAKEAGEESGEDDFNIFKPSKRGEDQLSNGGASGSKGQSVEAGAEDMSDVVQKAMEEAAKAAALQSEIAETSCAAETAEIAKKPEVKDTSTAIDTIGSVDDICTDYHEFYRAYELTEDLPLYIQQECDLIRRQYEQYFKSRCIPRRRNQKAGKLDTHALRRIVRGDSDIYIKRSEDTRKFSGCIEIRLDASGSMFGPKMQAACEALARIEEILKGLVPIKITAFDLMGQTDVEIIKNWDETFHKNCTWNYLKYRRHGGGTPTAEALLVAEREMMKRMEKHKMIILLTDENASNSNGHLKDVIRGIRNKGIHVCGIYFEHNMSQSEKEDFYHLFEDRDAIACLPEEISKELLPVIQKFTKL